MDAVRYHTTQVRTARRAPPEASPTAQHGIVSLRGRKHTQHTQLTPYIKPSPRLPVKAPHLPGNHTYHHGNGR